MQKELAFDRHYEEKITNETVRGILLEIDPNKDDGAGNNQLCPIADLNKIQIDIVVRRALGNGQFREVVIFAGYMEDLLVGMYAQNTKFQIVKTAGSRGYQFYIDFFPMVARVSGKDELMVRLNVPKTTFTGTVASRSTMQLITMKAPEDLETQYLPQIKTFPVGFGQMNIDEELGNNIIKVVAATDFANDYLTSDKAKIVSGDLYSSTLNKPFTEAELLCENTHFLDMNPDTPVQDLCLYFSEQPLNNVKVRAKLSMAADNDTKLITLGLVRSR